MKLSPRLQAIADWIDHGARLADIGTDHGLLPIFCAMNGITALTVASDVRESPLASAIQNASECGVDNRIRFLLSPGLERIEADSVDTIVTAGMGGETIIDILSKAQWIRNEAVTLLLQPQSKINEVQHWLTENGFHAEKARLVRDAGRVYLVVRTRWDGTSRSDDPYFLHLLSGDVLLREYASHLLSRTEKQLLAFRGGNDSDERKKLEKIRALLLSACADETDPTDGEELK